MNRREMRRRIYVVIAGCLPSPGIYTRKMKSLEEELEDEFMMICKFKEPSAAKRRRWENAIHEVKMSLYDKDPRLRDR